MTRSRPSGGRLWPFALAYAGGVVSYLPLLTLLLPARVAEVAGAARDGVLVACVVAGAVAASLAGIAFGWLSDRAAMRGTGRRRWMAGGLAATAGSYVLMTTAPTPASLVGAVVVFQVAVNAFLVPLNAAVADEVPDARRGLLTGLFAAAQPVAAGVAAGLLALPPGGGARLIALPLLATALALPLLARAASPVRAATPTRRMASVARRDFVLNLLARFLVHAANNAVVLYLLYYFAQLRDEPVGEATRDVSRLLLAAAIVAVPVAVVTGRWSDRAARRQPFVVGAAAVAAAGLAMMALARDAFTGAAGFVVYQVAFTVFGALNLGHGFSLLARANRRGRDLGLLNLANTLPSLVGPVLAWLLLRPGDYAPAFAALALLTVGGGLLVLPIRARG